MKIIRMELTENEVSPPNLRYDDGCDCIQQTPDGGTTWVDVPEADPRHANGFRMPPLSGEDARCDAAAREVAAWREVYNTFISSTTAAQFATIILNALLLLAGGVGVLLALLFLAFDALIFIGKEEMEAAFDDDVWDGIMCIIYCHIAEDGSISQEQLDAIYSDIFALYPGTIYNTLIEIGHLFGEVLLSNASVERSETGDCDECACAWCYTWLDGAGFSPAWSLDFGSYNSGTDQLDGTNTNPSTGNTVLLQAKLHFDASTITWFSVMFNFKSGDTFGGNSFAIGNGTTYGVNIFDSAAAPTNDEQIGAFLGGVSVPGVITDLWIQIGVPSKDTLDTYLNITQITIRGTGTNPFGDDNCV